MHDGRMIGFGYSGRDSGLNNAAMQETPDIGPIPQGEWTIGPADTLPHLGPNVMALTPNLNTDDFGRSGFYIHGDNAQLNHSASCGCIILGPSLRLALASSDDRQLIVTA